MLGFWLVQWPRSESSIASGFFMNHKHCQQGQYEEAEKEKSWLRLLPYPCLLVRWQLHHPQSVTKIAQVSSHLHGLFCWERCLEKTIAHPKGHELCLDKCKDIDTWIKNRLQKQLFRILQARKEQLGQQTLL